jgi:hypothetical protein
VKPAGISGIKRAYLKYKIEELSANFKNKNITDPYKNRVKLFL